MVAQTVARPDRTYAQILKSSVLVGCSSAANILIGIARAKVMAVLLGPAGVGLTSLYGSIIDLTSTIAGMGVNSSGVRQIAAAVGSGDADVIARTTVVLRRVSILLGTAGAALVIALSKQISAFTFGSSRYAGAVCLLSIAVFFKLVSAGQGALIQGMRRISDLAKMSVWGAVVGSLTTIILIFYIREQGIVLSLVCGAAVSLVISWRYSRNIRIPKRVMLLSEAAQDAAALLKLGAAFMVASLATFGTAYVIRIMMLRRVGLEGAGLYQSAWTIGGLYVGFILQAMGADFYPRLTASAHDNAECNRLINEQTFVGLLLGGPGVLATLTLAPTILSIFYTAKFHGAVDILRWFCLGTLFQVMSWPMGFLALAKGRQNVFLLSDLAWTLVYIGLAWIGVSMWGLTGAGMAFCGSYVFHLLITYPIARSLSGFRWSNENKRHGLLFVLTIATVFGGFRRLPVVWAACLGIGMTALMGVYSLRILIGVVPLDSMPAPARLFIARFRREAVSA